jgi:hypothetical protein
MKPNALEILQCPELIATSTISVAGDVGLPLLVTAVQETVLMSCRSPV